MQAGHEKTLTFLLPALAGANAIYGGGMLESGMLLNFGQLVSDNEMISAVKQILKGIPVNDETLAVDVIREVGARGHFLSHRHTFERMRDEHFLPDLMDRNVHARWEKEGERTMASRADDKAREILENHEPEPLADGLEDKLRSFIEDATKKLARE